MTRQFLLDPAWNALTTVQKHFVGDCSARRYPAEVVPFGALAGSNANIAPLNELLVHGEHVYLFDRNPSLIVAWTGGIPFL